MTSSAIHYVVASLSIPYLRFHPVRLQRRLCGRAGLNDRSHGARSAFTGFERGRSISQHRAPASGSAPQ